MVMQCPSVSQITYLSACSLHLFKQRQSRTHMQKGWSEKMPDFVRRLEDALYRTAHSKVRPELKTLQAKCLILATTPNKSPAVLLLEPEWVCASSVKPNFVVSRATRLFLKYLGYGLLRVIQLCPDCMQFECSLLRRRSTPIRILWSIDCNWWHSGW